MAPPQRKYKKGILRKLFILDAQGGYTGEFPVDPDCVVEYSDFLAKVPEQGLADGTGIYLGEHRATALHGRRISLVAISRGPLGPEELTWARATLVAAETQLTGDGGVPPVPGPDPGVMESLARAQTEREEQLAAREAALEEMEKNTRSAIEAYQMEVEAKIAELKTQLAASEEQHQQDAKELEAARSKLREELEGVAKADPAGETGADFGAERAKIEKDRAAIQERAHDLLAREEKVREREEKVEAEGAKLAKAREEVEALREEVEAAKAAPPDFDVDAAQREIEMRVKILQEKALDLLAREEKLRKKEKEILSALGG